MTDQPVTYSVSDGVATITLNRPDAMNSLDVATKVALRDSVTEAAGDPAVRCVVLTGSGRAFCVGQDLKEHIEILRSSSSDELFRTVPEHYNPTVQALATMNKPVVAAVNGVAAGAGASLAFACDFRILADSAGFNLAFTGVALSCDTGASWTLPRLVGRAKALELLYFPRTIPAQEALDLGLATKVVAPGELEHEVAGLAERLAAGPTVAFGAVRRAVEHSAGNDFETSLDFEAQMMALTGATEDHANAVSSFVAKEKPVFQGR
ncbi:MAG TPA: enoyl-CoA hydratase-related protein [Nocardioidaceae bacterium]|nr:enoyl-CoA hydratase-related protein [Nocardioidaceae bacterium]